MHVTIRQRLVLWLLVAVLPIVCAGFVVARQANATISERAASDVSQLLQLEVRRINDTLDTQSADATRAAGGERLVAAMEVLASDVAAYDTRAALLDARRQIDTAVATSSHVEAVEIVNRNGDFVARTDNFNWTMPKDHLAMRAMDQRRSIFGDAFVTDRGDEHLGQVTPIISVDGSVLGALLVETRLAPLVDPSRQLEDFGDTSEALIIQRTSDMRGQAITLRRFERNAAFSATVEVGSGTPSARSIGTVDQQVIIAKDYRGATALAAIDSIERTGWGVVVKIDRAEALALSRDLTRFATVALVLTLAVIYGAWRRLLRPLGSRLRETAQAAERMAGGDYSSRISDTTADEIGDLSRGIDRLAHDLEADIAARERVERQLRYQANHDVLTGLTNRQFAQETIDNIDRSERYAVLFLDLDGFKEINDVHGHGIGDEVLVSLAQRLTNTLPEEAIISRWGGDEFLVVHPANDDQVIDQTVQQLTRLLREPIATRAGQHAVGVSVGIARSQDHATGADVVLAADADMFRAKHNRRSSRTVSPAVIRLVETALAEDRLEPYFQPVVNLSADGTPVVSGAEALVRIRGIDGSTVPPGDFLPALGTNELARSIDVRVMAKSMATLGAWHRRGAVPPNFRVALNVGAASVNDASVLDELAASMRRHQVQPGWVLIEIPETVEHVTAETLDRLHQLGVLLAIDDVGVAHSNLERMVDMNADIAKLDRRWIPDLATSEHSKFEVLQRLVEQCRGLGLDVIAEGVETEEQVAMLRELGVQRFQGFFFGRPVSAADFERAWCQRSATEPIVQSVL